MQLRTVTGQFSSCLNKENVFLQLHCKTNYQKQKNIFFFFNFKAIEVAAVLCSTIDDSKRIVNPKMAEVNPFGYTETQILPLMGLSAVSGLWQDKNFKTESKWKDGFGLEASVMIKEGDGQRRKWPQLEKTVALTTKTFSSPINPVDL